MVEYNKEKAKQEYDKRYSTFTFVPGYAYELSFINRAWKVLNAQGVFRQAPRRAVDLGSGFGFKTYAMSKKIDQVTGIDISSNAILISNTLNDNPKLDFICTELEAYDPGSKFDLVTAFGLSNFNVSDIAKLTHGIRETLAKLLDEKGTFILYSSTDFSGKAPSGWYYHTRKELKELLKTLSSEHPACQVQLIFPHRNLSNYTKMGARNFLAEVFKLFFQRKKEYLLTLSRK